MRKKTGANAFKTTLAVKLDSRVAERVRSYCAERGIKQGFFVEKALKETLDGLAAMEEEGLDLRAARAALREKGEIPYDKIRRKLGLA